MTPTNANETMNRNVKKDEPTADARREVLRAAAALALGAGVESRQNGYETCQIEHQVRLTILTTCRRRFCCCWVAFS